jgi:hypothetical protein
LVHEENVVKDSARLLNFGKTWRVPVPYGDSFITLKNKAGVGFRAFHTANSEYVKRAIYSVLFDFPYVTGGYDGITRGGTSRGF